MKPGSLREDHAATFAAARTLTQRRIWAAKDALHDTSLTKAERAELEALIAQDRELLDEIEAVAGEAACADYANPSIARNLGLKRRARRHRRRLEEKINGE